MRNQLESTHPFISVFLEKRSHLPGFNCVSTLWLISHGADTHSTESLQNALQLVSATCQLQLMFPPVRSRTKSVPSPFICVMFIIPSWLQRRRGDHFTAPSDHWVMDYFGYLAHETMDVIKNECKVCETEDLLYFFLMCSRGLSKWNYYGFLFCLIQLTAHRGGRYFAFFGKIFSPQWTRTMLQSDHSRCCRCSDVVDGLELVSWSNLQYNVEL